MVPLVWGGVQGGRVIPPFSFGVRPFQYFPDPPPHTRHGPPMSKPSPARPPHPLPRAVLKGGKKKKRTFTETLSASWSRHGQETKSQKLVVGGWRLKAIGSWRLVAVGGWWSLGAVLNQKKGGSLRGGPGIRNTKASGMRAFMMSPGAMRRTADSVRAREGHCCSAGRRR